MPEDKTKISGEQSGRGGFEWRIEECDRFFQLTPALFCVAGPDGYFKKINSEWEKVLGFSGKEILEMGYMELLHPDDIQATRDSVRRHHTGNRTITFINRYRHKDGSYRIIEWRALPAEDGLLYAAGRDITAQKQLEKITAMNNEIFRSVAEGICLVGTGDGLIKYANERFEKLFGYEKGEMLGKHVSIVNAPGAKSSEETAADIIKTLERTGEWHGEIENIKKDGTRFWCSANVSMADHPDFGRVYISVHTDITARKSSEANFRESQTKFQALVETTSDFIWEMDQRGAYTYCSPQMEPLWGIKPAEMLGKTPFDLLPPEDREQAIKGFSALAASASPFKNMETRSLDGNGRIRFLEISGVPFFDAKGILAGYRGITRDITERKRAEEALRESENKYRTLFDQAADGIMLMAADGKELYVNSSFAKMHGYASPEEMKHLHLPDLDTPETAKLAPERLRRILAGESLSFEVEHYHKDGHAFQLSVTCNLVQIDGKPHFLGFHHDITARRRAELLLKESETRYQTLFETNVDGILVADTKEKRFRYANSAVCRMFGYTREEMLALGVADIHPKEALPAIIAKFEAYASGGTTLTDIPCIKKSGEVFSVDINGTSALIDNSGYNMGIFRDVSERNKVLQELQKSTERMTAILSSLNEAIFVVNPETRRISDCNDATIRVFGYSHDEMVGRDTASLHVDQEHFERFGRAAMAAYKDPGYYSCEFRMRRRDGTVFPTEHFVRPVRDGSGKILYVVSVVRDITERNLSIEALRRSEDKYQKVFQSAPFLITLTRLRDGLCLDCNEGFCQESGFSRDEIIGKKTVGLGWISPETRHRILEAFGKQGKFRKLEIDCRAKDGRALICSMSGELVNISGEEYMLATAENITKRKQAELELQESKSLVDSIIDNAPVMIFLKEAKDLRFELFNRAGEELLGYDRKELLGKNNLDLFPPEQAAHFMAKDREVLDGKDGYLDIPEEPILTAKKGTRLLHTQKVCIRGADGHTKYLLGISEDITDRRKAEEAAAKVQKLESLGTLAGGIAHDFNNILTTVAGNISVLRSTVKGTREVEEMFHEAQEACGTAANLARQLLTFAKGGAPETVVADLRTAVKSAANFAARGLKARCILELGDKPLAAKIDRDQIAQVVQNLILNAAQAMSGDGDITVRTEPVLMQEKEHPHLAAGRYIKLTVKDQGPGIPPEHLDKVFDPYFSTKSSGRGLGLAVCFSIMHRHGGCISAESRPGDGAQFTLFFPAMSAADIVKDAETPKIVAGTGRVLIMDDDAPLVRVLTRMLKKLGYQADSAVNGTATLEAYRKAMAAGAPYAAVIMDLTIPGGMGGKEAILELKKLDPKAKAVVSSGYSDDEVMSDYASHGFLGALNKPYRIEEVSETMRRLLGPAKS